MRFLSANGFLPVCNCKSTHFFKYGKKYFFVSEFCRIFAIRNHNNMAKKNSPLTLKAATVDPLTDNEYRFSIEYYIFVENGDYIAWSPSLDICTSGKTSDAFKERMESAGAHVRMAMFLAKTKNYRRTNNYKYN